MKKYWAFYTEDGGLTMSPVKSEDYRVAWRKTFERRMGKGDIQRSLGTRRDEADKKFDDLLRKHREERERRGQAERDLESEVLDYARGLVHIFEEKRGEFVARVAEDPTAAIRWGASELVTAQHMAYYAGQIIRHADNGVNPVHSLRWVVAETTRNLVRNTYGTTASMMATACYDAQREAASRFADVHFGAFLVHAAQVRDEARAELGMEPIDYEAKDYVVPERGAGAEN